MVDLTVTIENFEKNWNVIVLLEKKKKFLICTTFPITAPGVNNTNPCVKKK